MSKSFTRHRIFVASPYSHKNFRIQKRRYKQVQAFEAYLHNIRAGLVYSPINDKHPVAHKFDLPGNSDYWEIHNDSVLRYWATHFILLILPGYECSLGCAIDLWNARRHQLRIMAVMPHFLGKEVTSHNLVTLPTGVTYGRNKAMQELARVATRVCGGNGKS